MNTRALLRWTLSIIVAVSLLGVIGLALQPPAQARASHAAVIWIYPGCGATLQACVDAAGPDDTIQIRPGVYTESVTLAKPVSLVGDDRATTVLQAPARQRALTVTGNVTFTTVISGITFRGGDLIAEVCPMGCGGGILLAGAARPSLQNIALVGNAAYQGGGLWADGGADVKLVNVSFVNNTAGNDGGGLWTIAPTELVNNVFDRNTSINNGGGVIVGGLMPLTADGTTFVGNTAINGNGGGAYVAGIVSRARLWSAGHAGLPKNVSVDGSPASGPVAVLIGGSFRGNSAMSGGGVHADSLIMTGTDFIGNSASFGGGGAVVNGLAQLQGGKFISNTTNNGNGGGLLAASVLAQFTTLIGNTATGGSIQQGGAMFLNNGPNDLDQVWFQGNEAQSNGGGLYTAGATTLTAVSMISNSALAGQGGGAFIGSPTVVQGGSYVDNFASVSGGGIYAYGLTADGAHFDANHTPGNGAALHVDSAPLQINHSTLRDNVAGQRGGGIYASGDFDIVSTVFLRNEGSSSGGGMYHDSVGNGRVVNSLFARNTGSEAGAALVLAASASNVDVVHTTIADQPRNGDMAINNLAANLNISNTIIAGHATGINGQGFANHSYMLYFNNSADVLGNVIASGPIITGTDPLFADVVNDDYHLRFNSPAIDKGADAGVNFDFDGQPRPIGAQVDIGFDESATSIQEMIDAMPPGGIVNIPPGVYTESLTLYKPVSLSGAGKDNTIINAVTDQRVLTVTGDTILSDTQIAGLTLQGGRLISPTCSGFCAGGGVLITDMAYPSFHDVRIRNNQAVMGGGLYIKTGGAQLISSTVIVNTAQNQGGGIFVDVGRATLENASIVDNFANTGGGLYVRNYTDTAASLIGGKVDNNRANGYGGGIYAGSTTHITGTRFFGNSAYDGSAMEVASAAQVRLVNAFIGENEANGASPSTNASVRFDSSANSVVFHTTFGNGTQPLTRALVVNNGVVTVANTIVASYLEGLHAFGGHLAEDYNLFYQTPVTASGFVSSGGHSLVGLDPQFKAPSNRDYHIKGMSPAVNRGTNLGVRRDIDLDARPLGGAFDIGADEGSVAGTTPGPNTGGSFIYTTSQNSTINVSIPPGAVTQTTAIYCSLIPSDTVQPPHSFAFAGVVFELDANTDPLNVLPGSISFNVPVTLSVSYTDQQLAAAGITDELTLQLFRFEPLLNEWKPIGYRPNETQTLDVDNNLITATVMGFSRWGQAGKTINSWDVFLPLVLRN